MEEEGEAVGEAEGVMGGVPEMLAVPEALRPREMEEEGVLDKEGVEEAVPLGL
jgi:hypothetical protein